MRGRCVVCARVLARRDYTQPMRRRACAPRAPRRHYAHAAHSAPTARPDITALKGNRAHRLAHSLPCRSHRYPTQRHAVYWYCVSILHMSGLMPPPAPLQALRSTFNRAEPVRVGQAAPIGWHLLYFRAYELLSKDLGADGYENWRTSCRPPFTLHPHPHHASSRYRKSSSSHSTYTP